MNPRSLLEESDFCVREAHPDEAAHVAEYHRQNREFHRPWEPSRTDAWFSEEHWSRELKQAQIRRENDQAYLFFLFQDHAVPVGKLHLSNVVRGPLQACHLGFSLAESAQGQGLMFQATLACLEFAFKELKLHRVMANYIPSNTRSEKLLARCGFEREGLAKDYLLINGVWQDHVLTSKVNPA